VIARRRFPLQLDLFFKNKRAFAAVIARLADKSTAGLGRREFETTITAIETKNDRSLES
jgi:hypothetical protein